MHTEKKLIQALMKSVASAHPPLTATAHISTHIKNYIFNAAREQQSPGAGSDTLVPIEQIHSDHYHAAITAIISTHTSYRHAAKHLHAYPAEQLAQLQILDIKDILDDLESDINTEIEKIISE